MLKCFFFAKMPVTLSLILTHIAVDAASQVKTLAFKSFGSVRL